MKKDIHPAYQKVLFVDSASGHRFVCGSTLTPQGTEKFEGVDYPVYYLSISSTSHPFFTGSKQLVDSEGRVDKFNKRFGTRKEVPLANPDAVVETVKAEVKKEQPKPQQKAPASKAPAKPAKKK